MKNNKILSIATSPHAEPVYTDIDLTRSLAVVVGTEQVGLSEEWLNAADINVRIPMLGKIDSLNVATAATILLYEVARQRNWRCGTGKVKL